MLPGGKICFMSIGLLALFHLLAPFEVLAGKQQTRMIQAIAMNPNSGLLEQSEVVDRKQIDISGSYDYVSHSVSIISANPMDGGNGDWSHTEGVIKDEAGRVEAVWIEVRAGNKGLFGDNIWVRAQLTVVVEEHDARPAMGEDSPGHAEETAQ